MKSNRNYLVFRLMLALGFFVLSISQQVLTETLFEKTSLRFVLVNLVLSILLALLILRLFARIDTTYDKPTVFLRRKSFIQGAGISVVTVLLVATTFALALKYHLLPVQIYPALLKTAKLTPLSFGSIFRIFFIAPLNHVFYMISIATWEEIFFRIGLLHTLVAIGKPRLGLFVSGTVFGLAHILNFIFTATPFSLQNAVWVFHIIIAGLFLGYLYLRFGLLLAVFFHWFWNSIFYALSTQIEVFYGVPIILLLVACTTEYISRSLARKQHTRNT